MNACNRHLIVNISYNIKISVFDVTEIPISSSRGPRTTSWTIFFSFFFLFWNMDACRICFSLAIFFRLELIALILERRLFNQSGNSSKWTKLCINFSYIYHFEHSKFCENLITIRLDILLICNHYCCYSQAQKNLCFIRYIYLALWNKFRSRCLQMINNLVIRLV